MSNDKNLKPKPYEWALECIQAYKAHKITQSSKDIIVAVIDLGYSRHPDMEGHLWEKEVPGSRVVNGYDAFSDDYTLAYDNPLNDYHKGHHTFVAGEVAVTAPKCKIMIVRIGYGNPDCWSKAVRYAVDNGAKIIAMPHGYLNGERQYGKSLFESGGDFAYPYDNVELLEALDYACEKDCMIFSGTCDNRGRRVAYYTALDSVIAVGSTNRFNMPADICDSSDYTVFAAPSGERKGIKETDHVYGYGGDQNYIYFTGGCMACGFAAGTAALVRSKYPDLKCKQIKQIMANTAFMPEELPVDEIGRNDLLGFGIINAYKAVSIENDSLCKKVVIRDAFIENNICKFTIENMGVFDSDRTLVTLYNGNPRVPVVGPGGEKMPPMTVKQIQHSIIKVRGFSKVKDEIILKYDIKNNTQVWMEIYSLDLHGSNHVCLAQVR